MQVDLMKVLPDYFREVKDFSAIMETEAQELEKAEDAIARIHANNFILTADPQTLSCYERLLKIRYISGDTEERKKNILLQWKLLVPYTLPKLKEVLAETVGEENVFVDCRYDTYQTEIQILEQDIIMLRNLFDTVFKMMPAHIELLFSARYRDHFPIPIQYNIDAVCFRAEFFPRYNLAYLRLDGSWKLDGTRRLNGYDSSGSLDFYPVQLRTGTGVPEDIQTAEQLRFAGEAEPDIKTETSLRIQAEAIAGPETRERMKVNSAAEADISSDSRLRMIQAARFNPAAESRVQVRAESAEDIQTEEQLQVRSDTGISIGTSSYITKLNRLDGTWKLDDSRKLDGGRYDL